MLKINLENLGQDIRTVFIEGETIVHTAPFQFSRLTGCLCDNASLLVPGSRVMWRQADGPQRGSISTPVHDVSPVPRTEFHHKRRGSFWGYLVLERDEHGMIGILLSQDVQGKTRSDLWRSGEVVMFHHSFLLPEKKRKKAPALAAIDQEPPARLVEHTHAERYKNTGDYNGDRHERDYEDID